ncbi:MAG: hypothetical protein ACRDOU_05330 [Streptosporangiaceae bacterium]
MTGAAYGPQFPDMEDVWRAQDAPAEADRAGCSAAEYDRLVLERQQTEAAYLEGYDRELLRAREAIPDEPEPEAEP